MKDGILFWVLLIATFLGILIMSAFLGYFLYMECNFTLLWSILTPILVLVASAIVIFGFQFLMKHL